MKRILFSLLLLASFFASAQNNNFNSINLKWLNQQTYIATGTNTYSSTIAGLTPKINDEIKVLFTNGNTGASTFNGVTMRKNGGSALSSGDILPGATYRLTYDGTFWQVLGISSGGGSTSWASITGKPDFDALYWPLGGRAALTDTVQIKGSDYIFSPTVFYLDSTRFNTYGSSSGRTINSDFDSNLGVTIDHQFVNGFANYRFSNNFAGGGFIGYKYNIQTYGTFGYTTTQEFNADGGNYFSNSFTQSSSSNSGNYSIGQNSVNYYLAGGSSTSAFRQRRDSISFEMDDVTKLKVFDSGIKLFGSNNYFNFGTNEGATGYGIRDNAGTLQFKNLAGSWSNFSAVAYTDEQAQDAVGAMIDGSLTYVDGTPLLQRAPLTGAITASGGSNATALGSFTKAQLDGAVSDGNVQYVGDAPTAHTLDSHSNVTITSNTSGELLKWNGSAWINNTLAEAGIQPAGSYLTGNQTITLSGDVTGSGATGITTTIANGAVDIPMLSATGTPSATTFLRGDNTWATPGGGGGATITDGSSSFTVGSSQVTLSVPTFGTVYEAGRGYIRMTDAGVGSYFAGPNGNGSSGVTYFQSGNITSGTGTAKAADAFFTGGNGVVSNFAGGDAVLYGGSGSGSGADGDVRIADTNQKLTFFEGTPVVKQSAATDLQSFYDRMVAYNLVPAATLSGGGGSGVNMKKVKSAKWK